MAMHSAVLLVTENEKLRTKNQRQKRKRAQKRSYLAKGGILTGITAQTLIQNRESSHTEAVEGREGKVWQYAPPKCSLCQSLLHNARTCARRQEPI